MQKKWLVDLFVITVVILVVFMAGISSGNVPTGGLFYEKTATSTDGKTITASLVCGNGVCEKGENYDSCPTDCAPVPAPVEPPIGEGIDCAYPPSGLVSWWPGDNSAEDVWNGNDGELMGDAGYGIGYVNSAFSFDGGDGNYVNVRHNDNLNTNSELTILAWIYPIATTQPETIVSKVGGLWGGGYNFGRYSGRILSASAHRRGDFGSVAAEALTFSRWQHVAFVVSETTLRLYVDGELVAERSNTNGISGTTTPFRIGALSTSSFASGLAEFNGMIDEVMVFNRSLSSFDINRIFGAGRNGVCRELEVSVCGNRILESGEQCDDGNRIDGDGCSSSCSLEVISDCEPGQLDTTFSGDGKLRLDLGGYDEAHAVVEQIDGKIVVAGHISGPDPLVPGGRLTMSILRLNQDGTFDTTFGSGGVSRMRDLGTRTFASDILIQPDGKIIIVGVDNYGTSYEPEDFMLVRLNSDGTLDTTFGSGGFVTTNVDSQDTSRQGLLQPDGKIVVVGYYHSMSLDDFSIALLRYNSDGTLDTTFGSGGVVSTPLRIRGYSALGTSVVLLPSGKLLVGIGVRVEVADGSYTSLGLARYNSDGTLDTTFGSGGAVATDIGYGFGVGQIVQQRDGRIVYNGFIYDFRTFISNLTIVRYNSDGTLDTTFGTGGVLITNSPQSPHFLGVQRDGRIVNGGRYHTGSFFSGTLQDYFSVLRFNLDGSFDTTFGGGGLVFTQVGPDASVSQVWDGIIQIDGKILEVGYVLDSGLIPNSRDFAVVRWCA